MKQLRIESWLVVPPTEAAAKWRELSARRDGGEKFKVSKSALKIKAGPDHGYTRRRMVDDHASGYVARRREPKGAKTIHQRLKNAIADYGEISATAVKQRFVFDLIAGLADFRCDRINLKFAVNNFGRRACLGFTRRLRDVQCLLG